MPELKLYTVKQLREWLEHNHADAGLSDKIIAPTRAWAIVHNPYVKNDDPVLSAIFEDGIPVAYTAAFPEYVEDQRIWWFSTLWCSKSCQGKGYSLIVIGSLAEVYGDNCAWDRSGVPETTEVFNYLGNKLLYTPRYCFSDKEINKHTLKGKLAFARQNFIKTIKRTRRPKPSAEYELRYVTYIDDLTYDFISKHQARDLFLHSKDILNWELHYPFMVSAPIIERTDTRMSFHSYREQYQYIAVQVWSEGKLIGFYILRLMNKSLSVVYCYVDADYQEVVYSSVVEHISRYDVCEFYTELKALADYVIKHYYFPKLSIREVSFSPSVNYILPSNFQMQFGDGDSFA